MTFATLVYWCLWSTPTNRRIMTTIISREEKRVANIIPEQNLKYSYFCGVSKIATYRSISAAIVSHDPHYYVQHFIITMFVNISNEYQFVIVLLRVCLSVDFGLIITKMMRAYTWNRITLIRMCLYDRISAWIKNVTKQRIDGKKMFHFCA